MGGSQSAQRVTFDNPHDLNNVIQVSDDVVRRLKSPQRLSAPADAAGDIEDEKQEKKKPMIGTPVSESAKFYPVRDEMRMHGLPYLTTKDIQEYVQAEVDSTNKYWEERMKKLQEGHKKMERTMLDEYTKAQVELEKHLPRKIPDDAKVPCTELSGELAKCFKENQKQSLNCLSQVEAFKDCLGEARKQVVQEMDEYPDDCKYQEYREAAEKRLEEQKQKEAKKKEERDKQKAANK